MLSDNMAEARKLAAALNQLNVARREIEQVMTEDAELLVMATVDKQEAQAEMDLGICLFDESWHQGIVGIVAGRILRKISSSGLSHLQSPGVDEIKGSARSIPGVHIMGCS